MQNDINNMRPPVKFAFFGTPTIAVHVLDELEACGFIPSLVITNPDTPQGRKLVLAPSPVKKWAQEHSIRVLQPKTLKDESLVTELRSEMWDLFIVAAYGKLIPQTILAIPHRGTLNVHPSLLPMLRGASPIRTAILRDVRETGVTIMLMDEELDHGPILSQKIVPIPNWPPRGTVLDEVLAREGGKLLSECVPLWICNQISPVPQPHERATFSEKIRKEDGEIDLSDDAYQNLLKIRAFEGWPGTYFFAQKKDKRVRVKILEAHLDEGSHLVLDTVLPEGKKAMSYTQFLKQ